MSDTFKMEPLEVHCYPSASAKKRLEMFPPGTFVKYMYSSDPFPYNCGWVVRLVTKDASLIEIAMMSQEARGIRLVYLNTKPENIEPLESNPFESVILKPRG